MYYFQSLRQESIWSIDGIDGLAPDSSLPFIKRLSIIHNIWGYQQSLTTFVLTFFVNQAYSFWRDIYNMARSVQVKLEDVHLLVATNAKRNEDGTFTPEAQRLADDIGQFSRLYHVLMWASLATRFSVLNTPQGLQRMQSRGLMTAKQLEVLQSLDVPRDKLQAAPLEWMMVRAIQAMDSGDLAGDTATKGRFLKQVEGLHMSWRTIDGKLGELVFTLLLQKFA